LVADVNSVQNARKFQKDPGRRFHGLRLQNRINWWMEFLLASRKVVNQCALDFDRLTRKPGLWKFSTRAKSPTLGGCL